MKVFFLKILPSTYLYRFFDNNGIRCFVLYSESTGKYRVEIRRRKTRKESKGDHDWRMIRHGYLDSFSSRKEAEKYIFERANEILYETF